MSIRIDNGQLVHRNQNRSSVAARHGMVCTSQPLAAMAGLDALKAGGSAVDAAITANAMLGVVEPMMCGLGGDLFAIVWSERDRRLFGLNASGRAPAAWSINEARARGLTDTIPDRSPLAWSVPGCVSGWEALHERFGRLRWADLLAPAIATAREGFPVSPIIARQWIFYAARFPDLAETYLENGRLAPSYGDIATNPQLAATYETLAADGPRAFYEGDIAARIVAHARRTGGLFAREDFALHTADWVEPVSAPYRGHEVWELPPNGQGIAALQILGMLEHFDIGSLRPNSAAHLHLLVEAKKLAYEDRARYYADPAFEEVPVAALIDPAYAAARARLIDPRRAMPGMTAGDPERMTDTIYLTAADAEGNMVSLIQSIYYAWGSHCVPDRLGFALQNRGCSFSLNPAHKNALAPRKRPFHTIIPAFLTRDGSPVYSFGVMGGDFQPQGHAQVLMNRLDFGMCPQQAGEQPRVAHFGSSEPNGFQSTGPGRIQLEHGISDAVRAELAAMGHTVAAKRNAFGGYQGIARLDAPLRYFGGTDPRGDGSAVGY